MAKLKMFKARKETNRFRKNQRVWVEYEFGNHARIRFRWRGNGRYVSGTINKWSFTKKATWNPVIGQEGFKEIEVEEEFYRRITNNLK